MPTTEREVAEVTKPFRAREEAPVLTEGNDIHVEARLLPPSRHGQIGETSAPLTPRSLHRMILSACESIT